MDYEKRLEFWNTLKTSFSDLLSKSYKTATYSGSEKATQNEDFWKSTSKLLKNSN